MARLEVKHFAIAPIPDAAGAEHLAAAEAGKKNEFIRRGNIEILAVHFLLIQPDAHRDISRNGVSWIAQPEPFAVPFPVAYGAGGAQKSFHRFAHVGGV